MMFLTHGIVGLFFPQSAFCVLVFVTVDVLVDLVFCFMVCVVAVRLIVFV